MVMFMHGVDIHGKFDFTIMQADDDEVIDKFPENFQLKIAFLSCEDVLG